MTSVTLNTSDYSEWVVRKALYWCSPMGAWTLREADGHWHIHAESLSPNFESQLHRHLNDFTLREKLDAKTANLREAVISAALHAVVKGSDHHADSSI